MLRTNYRCVQSLNISVDVAKCLENVLKFTQFTHFLSVTKNDLSWLNNVVMARFQLNRMSSYANVTVLLSMLSCKPCKPSYHCHCLVIHVYYKYCILFLINQFFGHTNLVYIGRRGWFSEMALANHVSVPKPFGSGEAHEWLQKFELCISGLIERRDACCPWQTPLGHFPDIDELCVLVGRTHSTTGWPVSDDEDRSRFDDQCGCRRSIFFPCATKSIALPPAQ